MEVNRGGKGSGGEETGARKRRARAGILGRGDRGGKDSGPVGGRPGRVRVGPGRGRDRGEGLGRGTVLSRRGAKSGCRSGPSDK